MSTSFYDLSFLTAPGRVMTPRRATEALVDAALAHLGSETAVVADVGTGAGAVAVALAVHAPRLRVWATDLSPDAVLLARANAVRHGVADRVQVVRGDLLDPAPPQSLDVIVANLPYLPDSDERPEYASEPRAAIYAPGNGMGCYCRLLEAADDKLTANGRLLIQLHSEVVASDRSGLPALEARLNCLSLAAA
jgi:release factor glutamine methyltransferase